MIEDASEAMLGKSDLLELMGVLIVCGLSRHRFYDDRGSFFWATST